TSTW
ncbi:N-acetylmuramic acid 6-phosphate etherase domain protein, partial [Vibrio parahaemolyticus AQ3810]